MSKDYIRNFEPGDVQCSCCGWKPEDPWDTHPEGFVIADYGDLGTQWECEECYKENQKELASIENGPACQKCSAKVESQCDCLKPADNE